jgi:23S rRNA pseudouridine2457 synthase
LLLAFHKPFNVLSQFTGDGSKHQTLADFQFPKGVYPLGRLDADSEGLLLLSDEPELNDRLLNPKHEHPRTYWAQVEGIPTDEALYPLQKGLLIQGHITLPAVARLIQPEIAPRIPPIRYRKNIPDSWIELTLIEGKNRQVRRMTAAVGFPTLRLIRTKIGNFSLGSLPPGQWMILNEADRKNIF